MSAAKEAFDPAILQTLTDEERAAIAGDDADIHDLEALQKLADATAAEDGAVAAGPDDDDDDNKPDDAEAKPPAAGTAEAAEAAVVQPAPAATESPADAAPIVQEAKPVEPTRIVYDYQLPDDYQAKVDAIRSREDELAQQFKSGELDFDAYRAAARELDIEREALTDMRVKAAISQEVNQQTGESLWRSALQQFNATTAKADGIDYAKDEVKQADFDQFLKVLADKPENADKDHNWFISEAHKRVKALHGIVTAPPPNPNKNGRREPNLSQLPKTLSDVPGGDGPGDVSDEFTALDSLDGLAFEDALANLKRTNPAAFARYEAR